MNFSDEEDLIKEILFSKKKLDKERFYKLNEEKLIKVASSNLILPALYFKATQKKYINFISSDLKDYLAEIFNINKNRNSKLRKELGELNEILQSLGVNFCFLKGSAGIISNVYEDIGERMIGDIDILIEEGSLHKSFEKIVEIGYKPISNYSFFLEEEKHLNRQVSKDKLFAIELHRKVTKIEIEELKSEKILSKKKFYNKLPVPSYKYQLKNNIINHQINDNGYHYLNYNYRNLYDSYLLLKKIKNLELSNQKYIQDYFCKLKIYEIPIEIDVKTKIGYFRKFLIKLGRFRFFYFLNKKTVDLFTNLYWRFFKQIPEIFKNPNYRKYLLKEISKSIRFK